jgi:hypothetical protein
MEKSMGNLRHLLFRLLGRVCPISVLTCPNTLVWALQEYQVSHFEGLFFYLLVSPGFRFSLYACRFWTTFSLSDSNNSFDSTSVGLYIVFGIVLVLLNLISSGVTTCSPNKSLNGVKLVSLDTEVLWLQTAFDNSSTHFPFYCSSRHLLISVKMSMFAHSTAR